MPSFADPDRYLEILQPDRCPLCFTLHAYVHEHIKSLLEESVTDPLTRESLFKSRGFCRNHAWQAVRQRQALGMGVIYGSLLEKGLSELPRRRLWRASKPAPCPICVSEEKRGLAAVKEFALCWRDSEKLREAFCERGILCLPHLEKVLAQKMNPPLRKSLGSAGEKALKRLLKDLNEFLEKQDYHRSHEPSGKEWDAWIRVVRMVSGERD